MKTNIEAKQLARVVKVGGMSVSKRTTLPILSNVLVEIPEDRQRLIVTGTDLDVFTRVTIPTTANEHGRITVPKARIESAAKACKGATELSSQDGKFSVLNGSKFSIDTLPADYFPVVLEVGAVSTFQVRADMLKSAIQQVEFAQSTDEHRYVLNGVNMQSLAGQILLIATDWRRLATHPVTRLDASEDQDRIGLATANRERCERMHAKATAISKPLSALAKKHLDIAVDVEKALVGNVLVPSKTVDMLRKTLPATDSVVTVTHDGKSVRFTWSNGDETVEIISKQIEGNYPNWRQVVPQDCSKVFSLNRVEFLDALKAAETMTTDKNVSVKLVFSNGTLAVTANSPETGEFRKELFYSGDTGELGIAFNPRYLIEPLEAWKDSETVATHFTDEFAPVKMTAGNAMTVVMPMRLS